MLLISPFAATMLREHRIAFELALGGLSLAHPTRPEDPTQMCQMGPVMGCSSEPKVVGEVTDVQCAATLRTEDRTREVDCYAADSCATEQLKLPAYLTLQVDTKR